MKKTIVEIKEDIFFSGVDIFIGYTKKEYIDKIKERFDVELDENFTSIAEHIWIDDDVNSFNVIWVDFKDWTLDNQAILCHELIHLVNKTLKRRQIEDEETLAYLYEYYFLEASREISKLYGRNKSKSRSNKKTRKDS